MKRALALLVGAGIAVGGGTAAWAGTTGASGPKREAAKACVATARQEVPDGDKAALRDAVRACLEEAGIKRPRLRARRHQIRECVAEAREANPDAGREELRPLVKECLADR